jgi:type IV secretory pathway component VirB8
MKNKEKEKYEDEEELEDDYTDEFDSWEQLRNDDPSKTLTRVLVILLVIFLIIMGIEIYILYFRK